MGGAVSGFCIDFERASLCATPIAWKKVDARQQRRLIAATRVGLPVWVGMRGGRVGAADLLKAQC